MSRLSLLIGAAPGDGTGDPARTGGNKINLNFAELYAFLGGDTLTQTAGSVLLGNGTSALSSFASTAGRLVIGNGASGLTDDANLTWDATNGLTANKPISCPVTAGGGTLNERFGAGATISSGSASDTVIGANAAASNGDHHTVIGAGASTTGYDCTVIGAGSSTGGVSAAVVVGKGLTNNAAASVLIGTGSSNASVSCTGAIGNSVQQNHTGGMIIGGDIHSLAANEFAVGYATGSAQPFAFRLIGSTGAFSFRSLGLMAGSWIDSTDATRKARVQHLVSDTADREYMRADSKGSALVDVQFLSGGNFVTQGAALATNASDGFLYIPTSAGAPTGTPTAFTGTVATEYDTTNDLLKVYNSSWKTCPTQVTGSWTPADNSGAALTFTGVSANYTKIGNMVFAYFKLTYPVTASGANASISGLPFTIANADYATAPAVADTSASITGGLVLVPVKNTTTAALDVGTPVGPATNLQLSGATIAVMLIYTVA